MISYEIHSRNTIPISVPPLQNAQRSVRLVEKHRPNVIRGDKGACVVDKFCKEYDVAFTNTSGQRNSAILGSYAEVYDIAKTENGEKILEFIFSIIENAGVVVPGYFLV